MDLGFNGVYSKDNLPKEIKDGAYVIYKQTFIVYKQLSQ